MSSGQWLTNVFIIEFWFAIVLIVKNLAEDDTNDDDNTPLVPPFVWGSGSWVGKAPNIKRRRVFYSHLLFHDFWGPSPIYNATYFKKFFKIPIGLFDDIVTKVIANDDYFRQKTDAVGKMGLSSIQKICSAVRQSRLVSVRQNMMTSIVWGPPLAWKPWNAFAIRLLKCMEMKHSVTQMLLTSYDFWTRGVPLAFPVA